MKIFISVFLVICFINCKRDKGIPVDNKFRFEKEIEVGGLKRTFLVNLPPTYYKGGNFPTILAFHGGGGSGKQCEADYQITEKANSENFIIIYPDGVQSNGLLKLRTWNAGTCCDYASENKIDDVTFISELIKSIKSEFKVDSKRIYATGMSNGAMLCYRLACELSDQIAAIAPVSGAMVTNNPCKPSRSVPILHLHSYLDQKVPFDGGTGIAGIVVPSVLSGLEIWSNLNDCKNKANILQDDKDLRKYNWTNCQNNTQLELIVTHDGGHSWPGSVKVRLAADEPSKVINANDLIFNFFKNNGQL